MFKNFSSVLYGAAIMSIIFSWRMIKKQEVNRVKIDAVREMLFNLDNMKGDKEREELSKAYDELRELSSPSVHGHWVLRKSILYPTVLFLLSFL